VFVGNSITDGAVWSELFNDTHENQEDSAGTSLRGLSFFPPCTIHALSMPLLWSIYAVSNIEKTFG
jgi:hypothetical protein